MENKIKEIEEKLLRKEQECEELKEQLAEMISQSALLPKFFGLSAEEITQLATKCSQLKQTLTEIKEIVFPKNQLIITDSPIILKIQEKISEVEDETINN